MSTLLFCSLISTRFTHLYVSLISTRFTQSILPDSDSFQAAKNPAAKKPATKKAAKKPAAKKAAKKPAAKKAAKPAEMALRSGRKKGRN